MKPNIFNIATKELSQDSFFAWLLHWADENHRNHNEELHKCAQDFVKKLIAKQIDYKPEIKKIKAGRQWENIDVWAEVNDEVLIIIEDKTFTGEHSNQLDTYKNRATDWCQEHNYRLVCIYLKTGSEASTSLDKITNKGFAVVDRPELIRFFNDHPLVKSDIFNDFNERLQSLENIENSFESLTIKEWHSNSWIGFYQFLQSKINVTEWRYVANPAGGFLGLWWHFEEWKDYNVYLQIEQGNLCFKIGEVYADHSSVRNEWFSIIMRHAGQNNNSEIVKPQRFGSGTYMTVAIVERKNWLGDDDSILDKEKVIARLKEYEQLLDECVEEE